MTKILRSLSFIAYSKHRYKFPRSLITEVERLEMNNFVVRMFKPETIIYFKQVKDVELCYDVILV